VQAYQPVYEDFNPKNIYLDVNKNWTKDEFQTALRLFKGKNVYVFTDQLTALTPANEQQLFEELSNLEFSLFPLYKIETAENSLFVSKSTPACPNLADLKGTEYTAKLKQWLQNKPTLRIFNLTQNSENFAPYLKSLREFRTVLYAQGSVTELGKLVSQQQFVKNSENDQKVVLHNANMCIMQTDKAQQANAPDHLLRLFAYNDIMRRIGGDFFRNDFIREDLVNIAATANIVSPVSSLIVLEKQEDYDRFDIKKSKNSLQNASHKSSGAVPEPHEWLLMGLVVAVVLVLWWKK
jgi:XrtN system VIT domain protein